jgi:hypothetical protein
MASVRRRTPRVHPNDAAEIVRVPFHGDEIEAARQGERVLVPIRRVSARFDLSMQGQLRRLRSVPWATVNMTLMVGADGKVRSVACVDLDALPMWLATIEPSRVRPALRERLALYQREAARVLRDHFFGPRITVDLDVLSLPPQRPIELVAALEVLGPHLDPGVVRALDLLPVPPRGASVAHYIREARSIQEALAGSSSSSASGSSGAGRPPRSAAELLDLADRALALVDDEIHLAARLPLSEPISPSVQGPISTGLSFVQNLIKIALPFAEAEGVSDRYEATRARWKRSAEAWMAILERVRVPFLHTETGDRRGGLQ